MRVNRKEDYAVVLMTALASQPRREFVALEKVSRKYRLPVQFLRQIASSLKRAGLLQSKEGSQGGYRLGKKARTITLAHIMEAVGEKVKLTHCTAPFPACPLEQVCPSRDPFRGVHTLVLNLFEKTKLSAFIKKAS